MSNWHINPKHTGGIDGWVSLHKDGVPNCPFAYVHEDEALEIIEMHELYKLRNAQGVMRENGWSIADKIRKLYRDDTCEASVDRAVASLIELYRKEVIANQQR